MSQVYCWNCNQSYSKDKVFDIPVFSGGQTVVWCFNCAMKQLEWSDYRIVPKKFEIAHLLDSSEYKKFRIKSIEDEGKEYQKFMEELQMCYEKQFRKLKDIDEVWGELQYIAQEEEYNI